MRMVEQDQENDDSNEVTWEDQQKINLFSKLNTRMKGYEAKMETARQEKEALDDLSTELELADEDEPVLYRIGETYLHMPLNQAMKRLEKDRADLDANYSKLSESSQKCETEMKQLKVALYAKFGTAINLDE
ncbi:Prefoldin subunit 4 [Lentinula raphanica]|uniref:Prefoldin subunit 4 n=1 Tax=Lentinula raphanica TaxID=153919 RepID=A0AA38PGB6_9AGAR|nr:Prefoldin beta-like protein [Lentinula raphanica]KAJ3773014.1 Prefoldin subunit 4 [Lentinula raphanica]KAJ3826003.1 Prefoldin subunit 4 [Lentinula raphanica]KAJ3842201.1 Prefoldin subunit 4 [Lentinula raphanica]KAJ3969012.1 Prefoldin subunit 4 [Lentinula raphanica]